MAELVPVRYRVVRMDTRYERDAYRRISPRYVVVDWRMADAVVSRHFEDLASAQREADRLNAHIPEVAL